MATPFENLSTEKFRLKMRPHAEKIYQGIFPNSRIEDLRGEGVKVHILDKEFAIDTLWHLPSGQWISIQEKYRNNDYFVKPYLQTKPPYPDFTQEYKNACGTQHENNGEWFKLAAQLYFYGWANAQQTGFAHWIILNVARYKGLVEKRGGLHKIGVLKNNKKHGSASFYAISEVDLKQAIVMSGKA